MEAEVERKTGAGLGERSPERLTHRNGYRPRPWDTRVGTLDLQIPKVREGSYFPRFAHHRPEESARHLMRQQPGPVLGERRLVEGTAPDVQVEEPPEEHVVGQPFAELALRAHGVER